MDSHADANTSAFTSPLPRPKSLTIPQAPRKRPRLDFYTDSHVCPAGRAFNAPKQRMKAYWQFIVCVADEAYKDVPRNQLTRDHAKSFYCLSCDKELPIKKGKSVVGPHMLSEHVDEVRAFEAKQQRQAEVEVSSQLVDVLEPMGVSEQDNFNAILAEWVGKEVRPMSIVGDSGFIEAIHFANNAKTKLVVSSRQTVTVCLRTVSCRYNIFQFAHASVRAP